MPPSTRLFVVAAACALWTIGAAAQAVSAGVEVRRDRLDYHFDNPSSFDTPAPVAHFFEQHYNADNPWLIATISYGQRWRTAFGITPSRSTSADDFDTFFDPGGTVWVSGTSGPAAVRSFSVAQVATVGHHGSAARAHTSHIVELGYRLRVDSFDFGVGHKRVTRDGVLVASTDVTSPETTSSQLHQLVAAMAIARELPGRWTMTARLEATPIAIGRLALELPDKYPGQTLVFVSDAFGAAARAGASRRVGAWVFELDADAARTWSYRSTAVVRLTSLGTTFVIGRRW